MKIKERVPWVWTFVRAEPRVAVWPLLFAGFAVHNAVLGKTDHAIWDATNAVFAAMFWTVCVLLRWARQDLAQSRRETARVQAMYQEMFESRQRLNERLEGLKAVLELVPEQRTKE